MKIIYVTTSLEENDYNEFNNMWRVSLNPSNQNFHNKVIRSLALGHSVEVISIRPFSRRNCKLRRLKADTKVVGSITYHYLRISKHAMFRLALVKHQVKKLLKEMDLFDSVVVTDTINPKCTSVTAFIKRKFNLPCIGICTDSPSNITGTTRSYTIYLLQKCQKLDGFITLTEGLNFLYNTNNKKHITIEGIVESKPVDEAQPRQGKYIFFGGALLPRYGVYNLIEAFKKLPNKDVSLIICGHHANEEQIKEAISSDPRIEYLGTLPVKDVLAYEKYAVANINPRPFTQDLDRLSIPSKTLEYLASGALTISVKNTELEKSFKDTAIWAKSGEVEDLHKALEKALSMDDHLRKNIAESAKNAAIYLYSIEKISEKLTDFLSTFLS